MASLRAAYNVVAWGVTSTFNLISSVAGGLQVAATITYAGVKRRFEAPEATEAAGITLDNTSRENEERSVLPDGSVTKRRRLQSPTPNNGASRPSVRISRSPTPNNNNHRSSRYRNSPLISRGAKREFVSTDYTAGTSWSSVVDTTSNSKDSQLPTPPSSPEQEVSAAALKTQHFETIIPGTEGYSTRYDLTAVTGLKVGTLRNNKYTSRSRTYLQGKADPKSLRARREASSTFKKTAGSARDLRSHEEKRKRSEKASAHSKRQAEAKRIAEKKAYEEAKIKEDAAKAAEQAKAQEDAEIQERQEAARRAVRREAQLQRSEEARKRRVNKEAYAGGIALNQAPEKSPSVNATASDWQGQIEENYRLQKEEAINPERLWSPQDDRRMAEQEAVTKSNTALNGNREPGMSWDDGKYATPANFGSRNPAKQVRLMISPNSGLDAINHKTFNPSDPASQLNSPDGSYSRKDNFFERPFDNFFRVNGQHPESVDTRQGYGLPYERDDYTPQDVAETETMDTSIDMLGESPTQSGVSETLDIQSSDGSLPQAALNTTVTPDVQQPESSQCLKSGDIKVLNVATLAGTLENGIDTTVARPSTDGAESQNLVSSNNATVSMSSSGAGGDDGRDNGDDSWLRDNMSKMTLHKRARIRNAKKAEAEAKAARIKAEEEAAAAIAAQAQADEEERARKRAAEEAKIAEALAEAERKAKAARRMPKEKLINPISKDWEQRLGEEMNRGPRVTIAHCGSADLTHRDFYSVLKEDEYLNDEIVNAYLAQKVDEANKIAGMIKYAAHNTFFYPKLQDSKQGAPSVKRWLANAMKPHKHLAGENALDLEAIFIPVNENYHWTLIVVSPKAKTIEYFDSLRPGADWKNDIHVVNTRTWLAQELGSKYVAEEWNVEKTECARQHNGWDCGVFALTNAKCISLGLDPTCYVAADMPIMRKRIAAELINGGTIH